MSTQWKRVLALVVMLIVESTGYAAASEPKIWDTREGRWITETDLHARLATAPLIVLGEIHDHPVHHQIQTRLIEGLARQGPPRTLLLEMLTTEEQPALANYLREHPTDAGALGAEVQWEERGWPDWSLYRPVVQAALDARMPLAPADLPRGIIKQVAKDGIDVLAPEVQAELAIETAFPAPLEDALAALLSAAHCDALPPTALPGMVAAQHVRDAYMARQLLTRATAGGGVLLTGNGHLDRRWGVPAFVRRQADDTEVTTVALIETAAEDPAPALSASSGYDFIWFTEPLHRAEDPCAAFRAMQTTGPGNALTEKR